MILAGGSVPRGPSAPRSRRRLLPGIAGRAALSAVALLVAAAGWGSHSRCMAAKVRVKPAPPPGVGFGPLSKRPLKPPRYWIINYMKRDGALNAVQDLDGTFFGNSDQPIRVTMNPFSDEGVRVNVQGIHSSHAWPEVREHFEQVGEIQKLRSEALQKFGEVRFKTADEAWLAKTDLEGSNLMGLRLRVELDCSSDYLNKVLVHGLGPHVMWQDMKQHFKQAGQITFACIHGNHCKTAKVRFAMRRSAAFAMKRLNRKKIKPSDSIALHVCLPWTGTEDSTEVRVKGLPYDATEEDLRRHFSKVGRVERVVIEDDPLPPEFCEPAQ